MRLTEGTGIASGTLATSTSKTTNSLSKEIIRSPVLRASQLPTRPFTSKRSTHTGDLGGFQQGSPSRVPPVDFRIEGGTGCLQPVSQKRQEVTGANLRMTSCGCAALIGEQSGPPGSGESSWLFEAAEL